MSEPQSRADGFVKGPIDPAGAKVLWRMEILKRVRSSVPFLSRDDKRLAYVQDNNAVRIYDTIAEREIARFPTQGRRIQNLAFASDGKTLAISDGTDTVHLHDTTNGQSVRELKRDGDRIESSIYSLAFSPDRRWLAAASAEAPAYVWDVLGTIEPARGPITDEQLRRCWSELASADAAAAFQAIRHLAAAPEQTLPFLREQVKPVSAPDLKRVRQLVTALDSNDFNERRKAAVGLEKMVDVAASDLRRILAEEKPSLEVRRTLQHLLETRETTPEALRAVRAVEVLEWIATPEAMRLLGKLAKGAADARLTHEATEAHARLRR